MKIYSFPPLSISMALHMTANGAAGETQKSIKSMLGVDQLSDTEANEGVRQLTDVTQYLSGLGVLHFRNLADLSFLLALCTMFCVTSVTHYFSIKNSFIL